jgi:tetratricopeptide (TPR) repeat protein
MISTDGGLNLNFLSLITILVMLFFFIGYFRFIFGYFMRNFERQADIFCFQTGIDPHSLISSFSKLGAVLGDDSKRSNWHHFNINQRIDFIRNGIENPGLLKKHDRKIKRSLIIFLVVLVLFSILSFNPFASKLDNMLDLNLMVSVIQQKIAKQPDNPELFSLLGMVYYELKEWTASKEAYEKSLSIKRDQPDALNNLAWLLIKCPDKKLLNPKKALKFSQQASRLKSAAYILDTLAEAYLANSMYKQAYVAARNALKVARENLSYYRSQLKKMKEAFEHFGTTHQI